MNWLAKWYHRPEDYKMDRWLFLRNGYIVISVLVVVLSIIFDAIHMSDSKYFLPICGGVGVVALVVSFIRDRNLKNVQWNQDWFRGKYSKWTIWWRG